MRQQPTNLTAHFNLALVQTQTGQYRAAIETLDYILGRRPEFLSGYYQRSEVKRLLGDAAGADRDYWLAYKLERGQIKTPKATIADSTASGITNEDLYALEHHDEPRSVRSEIAPSSVEGSTRSLRGAIQEQGASENPCAAYEITYFVQKSHDKLLPRSYYSAELETYNQRTTYHPRLLLTVGAQSLDSTQLRIVLDDIAHLRSAEQTADWHLRMGIDHLLLRDIREAIAQFDACLGLSPQQPLCLLALSSAPQMGYLYYNRAHLYQLLGQIDQAIADYTRAIELLPQSGEAYFNRALLLKGQNKFDEATEDLSRAGELGIYQAYSLIHTIQGR